MLLDKAPELLSLALPFQENRRFLPVLAIVIVPDHIIQDVIVKIGTWLQCNRITFDCFIEVLEQQLV